MSDHSLLSLPEEDIIFPLILKQLTLKDYFNLRCVSKGYKNIVDNYFCQLKTLDLSDRQNFPCEAFEVFIANCSGLTAVMLKSCLWVTDSSLISLCSCNNIVSLDISECGRLTPDFFEGIMASCKRLENLKLYGNHWVTNECLKTVLVHCENLRSLSLADCHQILDATVIYDILRKFTNLDYLDLSENAVIDDQIFSIIAEFCHNMRNLRLVGCPNVNPSNETIENLKEICRLEHVLLNGANIMDKKRRLRVIVNRTQAMDHIWQMIRCEMLSRWSFHIFGCFSGKKLVYVAVAHRKTAQKVQEIFFKNLKVLGVPEIVIGNAYPEEVLVEDYVCNTYRGERPIEYLISDGRGCQRILHEINVRVSGKFRTIFFELENQGLLDPGRVSDLLCLSYIYFPRVNESLKNFCKVWNNHQNFAEAGSINRSFTDEFSFLEFSPFLPFVKIKAFKSVASEIVPNPLTEDNNDGKQLYGNLRSSVPNLM